MHACVVGVHQLLVEHQPPSSANKWEAAFGDTPGVVFTLETPSGTMYEVSKLNKGQCVAGCLFLWDCQVIIVPSLLSRQLSTVPFQCKSNPPFSSYDTYIKRDGRVLVRLQLG